MYPLIHFIYRFNPRASFPLSLGPLCGTKSLIAESSDV